MNNAVETPIKSWEVPSPETNLYPVRAFRRPQGVYVLVQSTNPNVLLSPSAKNLAWDLRKDADLNIGSNEGITADGGMFVVDTATDTEFREPIRKDTDTSNLRWRRLFRFTKGL
jgi:hypothetical protein